MKTEDGKKTTSLKKFFADQSLIFCKLLLKFVSYQTRVFFETKKAKN